MNFKTLFPGPRPLIAVIHLPALPGSPGYGGSMKPVYAQAVKEAALYAQAGVEAVIVENFNDAPFFPERVPHETTAAMAAVCREIRRELSCPLGINVLRNDGAAALSIAAAVEAQFVRINVHIAAVLADQGIIQGRAYETLRLRRLLGSDTLIFADVAVKHAAPLSSMSLEQETRDLSERGMADAIIVSGSGTGHATNLNDLRTVKANSSLPVLIGSGATPDSLKALSEYADGFIVGSWLKEEGQVHRPVSPERVARMMAEKKKY